jgi:hypothetical protein
VLLDPAVQEGEQHTLDDSPPGTVALGEACVVEQLEGLVLRLCQPVQGRLARAARPVRGRTVAGGAGAIEDSVVFLAILFLGPGRYSIDKK